MDSDAGSPQGSDDEFDDEFDRRLESLRRLYDEARRAPKAVAADASSATESSDDGADPGAPAEPDTEPDTDPTTDSRSDTPLEEKLTDGESIESYIRDVYEDKELLPEKERIRREFRHLGRRQWLETDVGGRIDHECDDERHEAKWGVRRALSPDYSFDSDVETDELLAVERLVEAQEDLALTREWAQSVGVSDTEIAAVVDDDTDDDTTDDSAGESATGEKRSRRAIQAANVKRARTVPVPSRDPGPSMETEASATEEAPLPPVDPLTRLLLKTDELRDLAEAEASAQDAAVEEDWVQKRDDDEFSETDDAYQQFARELSCFTTLVRVGWACSCTGGCNREAKIRIITARDDWYSICDYNSTFRTDPISENPSVKSSAEIVDGWCWGGSIDLGERLGREEEFGGAERILAQGSQALLAARPDLAPTFRRWERTYDMLEEQQRDDLVIDPEQFTALAKSVLRDYSQRGFDEQALVALQTAAEAYLVEVFQGAGRIAEHARPGRRLRLGDLQLMLSLTGSKK